MSQRAASTADASTAEARLFAELQRWKAASRLSFGRLAERTYYSRSSWERFLNGKRLPTPEAVEQLAAVVGEDPGRLLQLLDRATAESRESADPWAQPEAVSVPEDVAEKPRGRRRPLRGRWSAPGSAPGGRLLLCMVLGALLGALATGLGPRIVRGFASAAGSGAGAQAGGPYGGEAAAPAALTVAGPGTGCTGETCAQRDAQAMNCQWDARTVQETWLHSLHVELRYSPACNAVWGRIENGAVGDTVVIRDRTGLQAEAGITADHRAYTTMLAVTADAQPAGTTVCALIPRQKQQACATPGALQP